MLMMQNGCSARLIPKPFKIAALQRRSERKHLQGDATIQGDLVSLVDHTHAATSKFPDDAVISQLPGLLTTRERNRVTRFRIVSKLQGRAMQELQARKILLEKISDLRMLSQ